MAIYKAWMQKAEDDLAWCKHSLEGGIWYGAVFTAQQATEKALKAYLLSRNKPLRKIHDLTSLIEDCAVLDSSFDSLRTQATTLSTYYVTTRYPIYEEFAAVTEDQAKQAFADAKAILEFVKARLL